MTLIEKKKKQESYEIKPVSLNDLFALIDRKKERLERIQLQLEPSENNGVQVYFRPGTDFKAYGVGGTKFSLAYSTATGYTPVLWLTQSRLVRAFVDYPSVLNIVLSGNLVVRLDLPANEDWLS